MGDCLRDDTIAAYVDGALELTDVDRVDRHIDGCASCRAQLSAVAAVPVMCSFVGDGAATPSRMATLVASGPPRMDGGAPEPGTALGRYIVDAVIGRGGMGVVVRAHDPELDRAVAIKLVDRRCPMAGARRGRAGTPAGRGARDGAAVATPTWSRCTTSADRRRSAVRRDGAGRRRQPARAGSRGAAGPARSPRASPPGAGSPPPTPPGWSTATSSPRTCSSIATAARRVGDFGLAHAVADAGDRPGALCGTPAYMAPELFRGEPADARTDQLAFAVTVYEAIVGERPWRGDSLDALHRAVDHGPPSRPPAMPPWLWRLVARGLATDPAARHPSVAAFVDALERGTGRRGRRLVAGAAAIGLALTAAGAIAIASSRAPAAACPDPARQTQVLAGRIGGLCGSTPGEPCRALAAAFERRLAAWRTTHVAVCRATRDGRQSAVLLDARMRCLEHRLVEDAALVERLGATPADVLDARAAVDRLAGPDRCATLDRAGAYPAPPADRAAAVAEAERWIATAEADYALGHYREGLAAFAPHVDAIRATEHPPVLASAGSILGNLQREAGQLAAAEASFDLGLRAAAEAGDDVMQANLLLNLAYVVGESRLEPERGAELLRAAQAAITRAGNPPELESAYLIQRAGLAEQRGEFPAAEADFARAVELRRRSLGPDSGDTAIALQRLCGAESQNGKLAEGRRHCEEALEILRRALGPDHPITAQGESALAVAIAIEGDLPAARDHWLAALASLERSIGARSVGLAPMLLNLGDVSGMLGDREAAKLYLDRAIELTGSDEVDMNNLDIRLRIARQVLDNRPPAEAIAMLEELVQRADAQRGATHPSTASALHDLAVAYYQGDRMKDARVTFERAIAAHRTIYGERHAVTLTLEGQYGQTLIELGDPAAARPVLERVMLALEGTVDADSPFLAQAYANLADCLLELRVEPDHAVELAERGLAKSATTLADDPLMLAEVRYVLGQALWRAGRDRKRAVSLVRTARDEMRAIGPAASSLPDVERWLAGKR